MVMPLDGELVALLIAGGLLTEDEATLLPADFAQRACRDPYALARQFAPTLPSPALRWDWETAHAAKFCTWVEAVLRQRFGVQLQAVWEPAEAPVVLRLRLGEREEVVDWAYLNSARWMGSFCTIVARLLTPVGVEALELETGDFDTVVMFCAATAAEELKGLLPAGE